MATKFYKKYQENLDSLFELGEDLHILIMNVEALSTEGVKFVSKFLNSHKTLMAIDESTTIKNQQMKELKILLVLVSTLNTDVL